MKDLLWYLQDAANSICGPQGAETHQAKLLELHALLTAAPPTEALWHAFAQYFDVSGIVELDVQDDDQVRPLLDYMAKCIADSFMVRGSEQ